MSDVITSGKKIVGNYLELCGVRLRRDRTDDPN